jgi:integrase
MDIPVIEIPGENNARKGFFEREQFVQLRAHLPTEYRNLFSVAYITGWRVQSDLLTREWSHVDWNNRRLRVEPGEPKNLEGKEFPFVGDLEGLLKSQRQKADVVERRIGKKVTHVFFRSDGRAIRSYREAWSAATEASGINRIVHDFRRTAIRNLELAGVPRPAAMKMVGHKTESVYRRYAITDERMLQTAAAKLNEFYKQQPGVAEDTADNAPDVTSERSRPPGDSLQTNSS